MSLFRFTCTTFAVAGGYCCALAIHYWMPLAIITFGLFTACSAGLGWTREP